MTILHEPKSTYMKITCLIGLLISTLLSLQIQAQNRQLVEQEYEQYTLPNGLTVILQQDSRIPMVAVNVWYNVGSWVEQPGNLGFAHLLEHLMFEGTPHVGPSVFDQQLESAGGKTNAVTSYDHTYFHTLLPSNALDLMLYLESDRMGYLDAGITAEKLDRQREVVRNEYRYSYEGKPYGQKAIVMPGLLFPEGHPYHHPVIGSFADLDAATPADIAAFFRKYYGPANASLTIVGNFDKAYAKSRIEYWFGGLEGRSRVSATHVALPLITEPMYGILEDDVEAAQLVLQYPTPPVFATGDAAMNVLEQLLSRHISHKLVTALELAYEVRMRHQSHRLGSYFEIVVTARPGVQLQSVLRAVDEELTILKTQKFTEKSLIMALNQQELRWLKKMQYYEIQAFNLSYYYWKKGNAGFINEDFKRYLSLDVAALNRAAQDFLRADRRAVLSIVPIGERHLGVEVTRDFGQKK